MSYFVSSHPVVLTAGEGFKISLRVTAPDVHVNDEYQLIVDDPTGTLRLDKHTQTIVATGIDGAGEVEFESVDGFQTVGQYLFKVIKTNEPLNIVHQTRFDVVDNIGTFVPELPHVLTPVNPVPPPILAPTIAPANVQATTTSTSPTEKGLLLTSKKVYGWCRENVPKLPGKIVYGAGYVFFVIATLLCIAAFLAAVTSPIWGVYLTHKSGEAMYGKSDVIDVTTDTRSDR